MDYLRTVVSGKKKRFQNDGYNLDLTYVCSRVIAMSFPAAGLEGLYRNPIDQVVQVIEKRHQTNYRVFNLSGRTYDQSKFRHNVSAYDWQDHHAPPLHVLFQLCQLIEQHLMSIKKKNKELFLFIDDQKNVAVIHCLAGKGRTGTIICCFLLYSGRIQSVQQAMEYYSRKRFHAEGLGVNQPCQIRYIEYFNQILKHPNQIYPGVKQLTEICFDGRPKFNMDGGCRPNIEVINQRTRQEVYDHKKNVQLQKFIDADTFIIKPAIPVQVCGDLLIKFSNVSMISNEKMMRISLNTAFIASEIATIVKNVVEIDPSKVAKDTRFPKGFNIQLKFEPICNCDNSISFEKKCSKCQPRAIQEQPSWELITKVINNRKQRSIEESKLLLFGNIENDDIDQILNINQDECVKLTRRFSEKLKIEMNQQEKITQEDGEERKEQDLNQSEMSMQFQTHNQQQNNENQYD